MSLLYPVAIGLTLFLMGPALVMLLHYKRTGLFILACLSVGLLWLGVWLATLVYS